MPVGIDTSVLIAAERQGDFAALIPESEEGPYWDFTTFPRPSPGKVFFVTFGVNTCEVSGGGGRKTEDKGRRVIFYHRKHRGHGEVVSKD